MLSIIIPARNNATLTRDCIKCAVSSLDALRLKCQFILIDDLSDPDEHMLDMFLEMREACKRRHEVTIVRSRKHEHYTGVFSIGLTLAKREHAFFLSNDMLITPSFFAAVLGVAALSNEIGIVRGTSPYTDSHPEYTVPVPAKLRGYEDIAAFSRTRFDQLGFTYTEDAMLSGDAVLIRRPLIDAIGVLDTRFFGYFGDVDYGMRAHLAKFKLVCATGAWLYHFGEGHVAAEATKKKADIKPLRSKRMALVREAYKVFREKWDPDLPENFAPGSSTQRGFGVAKKNGSRVLLKFQLLPELLRELEYF